MRRNYRVIPTSPAWILSANRWELWLPGNSVHNLEKGLLMSGSQPSSGFTGPLTHSLCKSWIVQQKADALSQGRRIAGLEEDSGLQMVCVFNRGQIGGDH